MLVEQSNTLPTGGTRWLWKKYKNNIFYFIKMYILDILLYIFGIQSTQMSIFKWVWIRNSSLFFLHLRFFYLFFVFFFQTHHTDVFSLLRSAECSDQINRTLWSRESGTLNLKFWQQGVWEWAGPDRAVVLIKSWAQMIRRSPLMDLRWAFGCLLLWLEYTHMRLNNNSPVKFTTGTK